MDTVLTIPQLNHDEYITVGALDLHAHTSVGGWTLVAVIPTSRVDNNNAPIFETWHGYDGKEHRHYYPSFVTQQPTFLLGRTFEVREIHETIKVAQAANVSYKEAQDIAEKKLGEMEVKLTELELHCGDLRRRVSAEKERARLNVQRADEEHAKRRLMETDIVKVRKAIGDDRLREILKRELTAG